MFPYTFFEYKTISNKEKVSFYFRIFLVLLIAKTTGRLRAILKSFPCPTSCMLQPLNFPETITTKTMMLWFLSFFPEHPVIYTGSHYMHGVLISDMFIIFIIL